MVYACAKSSHHSGNVKCGGAATTGQLTTFVARYLRVCGVNDGVEKSGQTITWYVQKKTSTNVLANIASKSSK